MQVLYLGRAPCIKETLPDFREKCRVTRHSRVFRGLTGSQRTLGFGVSQKMITFNESFCNFLFMGHSQWGRHKSMSYNIM